jgi:cytochrome P450
VRPVGVFGEEGYSQAGGLGSSQFLATHPHLQNRLRTDVSLAQRASDEILRIHAPLIANRRRSTAPVTLGGRGIPAQERIVVVWASANRDDDVFGDPDEFRLDRDPDPNLLYACGIHGCPGAPLARLELRVIIEELFASTVSIEPAATGQTTKAIYPAAGFALLPLRFR